MKKWKAIVMVCLALALTGSMAACGAKSLSENATAGSYKEASGNYAADEGWGIASEMAEESADYSEDRTSDASLSEADQGNLTDSSEEAVDRKLIRNLNLSLETMKFDELQTLIEQKVNELGGYIESSTVDGTSDSSNRYSYLTIRIPSDQLDAFEDVLGSSATVLSKSSTVQDVTLNYSDLAAHISSLRIEQETLMDMLSKADSVDTIITIQNELTNVRYELESYESQMKVLENQISYSTVYVNIREVKTPTVQEKEGFFSRVKHTFINSISDVATGIEDFLVFFLGNIVGIILFLAIAIGILCLIRALFRFLFSGRKREKVRRKRGKKKEEEQIPAADELQAVEITEETKKTDQDE